MRRIFFAILVAGTCATANALAADDDVETWVKKLDEEHAALSTQDCVTACKALGSIRRAAERICALEAGPRCIDARTKADDAQRRVQAACPDCQIAAAPPKDDERRASKKGAPAEEVTANAPAAAPDRGRGGCASCSTPGDVPTGDFGVIGLAALAFARIVRARARARSRSMS